ncbi:MAG: IS5 family transposase [Myxococcota bacterium]|nr:IS5 family transposase [Myxococcota bacterium]
MKKGARGISTLREAARKAENLIFTERMVQICHMRRHELTDKQWMKIEPLIHHHGRQSKLGDRNFVNAVIYILKTGTPWRDLPERFGPWNTVYNRFSNWSKAGHFERIFKALQLDLDHTANLVDGSITRAHQDAAGGKGGSNSISWVVHVVDSQAKYMR